MRIHKGDRLIFKGSRERVDHFKNFTIGHCYTVSDITTLTLDVYNYNTLYDKVVLFEGFKYGVYMCEIERCFESIEDYRDGILSSLEL